MLDIPASIPIPAFIPIPALIAVVVFVVVAYVIVLFVGSRGNELREMVDTYTAEVAEDTDGKGANGSFWDRLAAPVVGVVGGALSSTAPQEVRAASLEKLAMAGNPVDVSTFLAFRGIALFGFPLAYVASVTFSGQRWGLQQLATLAVAVVVGRMLPDVLLNLRIEGRQKQIERSIPDAVDLIVACVEAGLSLDAALTRVAERMPGPLADEIARALHEMRLGRPRREALKMMALRTGVASLRSFSQAVAHAEQMGVAIADVLRVLGEDLRTKRKLRAQEMAQKAPLKMVPVIVFFILPGLFAVVLGPAVLSIKDMFRT